MSSEKRATLRFGDVLTPINLVMLGIYEETYELYVSVVDEFHRALADRIATRDGTHFNSKKWCKAHLNRFFDRYYRLFSQSRIYINDDALRRQAFCPYNMLLDRNTKTRYTYKPVTFSAFLKDLELLISLVSALRSNFNAGTEAAHHMLKKHIEELVKNKEQVDSVLGRTSVEFDLNSGSDTIWKYTNLHNLSCNQEKHKIVPKVVIVNALNSIQKCNLPVNYCYDCGKYFIGKNSLEIMQKKHGTLLVKTRYCSLEQCGDIKWAEFNNESELYSYGYNVRADGMTISDRQNLLAYLMQNDVMSKFCIRRDLENAINIFQSRKKYINAVRSWQDDLHFVDMYDSLKQVTPTRN